MNGKRLVRGTILTVLCTVVMLYVNSTVSMAYWVVVKSNNTRVRNAASTESEVMTAVNAGDKLNVVSEEQGSDGIAWYKVSINNVSGYVRSDTVAKESENSAETITADAGTLTASAETPVSTVQPVEASSSSVVEPMASQAATVNHDDVNVRSGASTDASVVAKLQNGAAVTLTGTTSDSSGKTWYQVNFINNGSNVTGFIIEDYVDLGEIVAGTTPIETPAGEEGAEGGDDALADIYGDMPTEEESANNDYELFFEPDADGVNCWYVHDNTTEKRYKLEQLLEADEMNTHNLEIKDREVDRIKLVVIVLAVLLVFAIAAAGFFGFKYHDLKDDDDEDDDDDDDFREAPPVRRRTGAEQESVRGRGRTSGTVRSQPQAGVQRRAGTGSRTMQRQPQTRRPEAEGAKRQGSAGNRNAQFAAQARRTASPVESAPVRKTTRTNVEWKSKNFLADDDDEYPFINMDEDV